MRWSRAISAVEHRQIGDQEYAKNQGEGEDHARNPGDDRIEPAAEEAGQYAEDPADEQDPDRGENSDEERSPGAVNRPGEDVAANRVVAEDVPGAGSLQRVFDVAVGRTFLGEQLREERCRQNQQGEQRREDEHRLAAQAAPGFQPAAGRCGLDRLRIRLVFDGGYKMVDFSAAFHRGCSDPGLRHTKDMLAIRVCPGARIEELIG